MPNDEKSREVNLDNRHLVACFIGAVIICGGFFALGFFVGNGKTREITRRSSIEEQQSIEKTSRLGTFQNETNLTKEGIQQNNSKLAEQDGTANKKGYKKKVETSKKVLSLQVSAVTNRTQAERLAQKLRSKGYPVFVLAPSKRTNPAWIKVQVGPFKTMKKVSEIKIKLKKDGYSSFLQSK